MYYIPFLYFIKTRAKQKKQIISWLLIYILPLTLIAIFYNHTYNLFIYLPAAFILVYSLYELGYIYNDVFTIKREKKPTLRLLPVQIHYIENNLSKIVTARLLISAIMISLLIYSGANYLYITCLSFSILLTYTIYNSIRNRFNLLLHFILVNLRYTAIVAPFLTIYECIIVILLFPFLNLLERSSEDRFNFTLMKKFFISNKKEGRYIYYLITTAIIFITYGNSYLLYISIYYFMYRLCSFYLLGSKNAQ